MPELPEVETVKRAFSEAALGGRIVSLWRSDKRLRWAMPDDIKERLEGRIIYALRRRGKYIIIDLGEKTSEPPDMAMLLHLGMSGSVRIYHRDMTPKPRKHDHLVMHIKDGANRQKCVIFNDPRRFGGVVLVPSEACEAHPLLRGLGVEPLGHELSGRMMLEAFKHKRAAIKTALLDQRIIAGLGNIYVSEALYRAGIAPMRAAGSVAMMRLEALSAAIKAVLNEAIEAGGTSLRDHIQPARQAINKTENETGGEIGYFAQRLDVYGRAGEACSHCGGAIKMIKQGGRASFYCPQCQT